MLIRPSCRGPRPLVYPHVHDDRPARACQSSAPAVDSRSPFVRLTELIAGIEPGKPPINLSVGEPQHPVPAFVGAGAAPRISTSSAAIRRTRASSRSADAVAHWLGRRYTLPRPVDPESEVLVLNGTREGLFLAAHRRQALGRAARRHGRPC